MSKTATREQGRKAAEMNRLARQAEEEAAAERDETEAEAEDEGEG